MRPFHATSEHAYRDTRGALAALTPFALLNVPATRSPDGNEPRLALVQMLRKSVDSRDWESVVEPKGVRAAMKRLLEDLVSMDAQMGQLLEHGLTRGAGSSSGSARLLRWQPALGGLQRPGGPGGGGGGGSAGSTLSAHVIGVHTASNAASTASPPSFPYLLPYTYTYTFPSTILIQLEPKHFHPSNANCK